MRRSFLILIGIISAITAFSQVKKQFFVENDGQVEKVDLKFRVNSGHCFIKPGETSDVLAVYSNQDTDNFSHSFDKEIRRKTCHLNLALEDNKSQGLSQSISYRMFGKSDEVAEKIWKVFLTKNLPYDLKLDYGIGNARMDLSGLAINKLKVYTGSADVIIDYDPEAYNQVEMDTFYVKVDLGSIAINKMSLSKARHVVADIGVGNLLMDFSDSPKVSSDINGSVGAGNLIILLPPSDVPVKVKVRNSWLCKVKINDNLKSIGDNTFVNKAY
ncbi:MAG: hypothetical protein R3345_14655, partial [Fulvivirga sp.]|nr:hypothetical protein [Fulvivirga sp.]